MTPGIDQDWFYLGVTLLIIAGVAGAHNLVVAEDDVMSFGYCDTSLECVGSEVGGACLGVEQKRTQCVEPTEASEDRRVEVECGVRAYNLCREGDHSGTSWASEATYQNKTCDTWADERDITLLSCDQSFPAADEWEDMR